MPPPLSSATTHTTTARLSLDLHTYLDGNVEAGGNHSALVDAADQLNNDFSVAVIIEHLELANVAYSLWKGVVKKK